MPDFRHGLCGNITRFSKTHCWVTNFRPKIRKRRSAPNLWRSAKFYFFDIGVTNTLKRIPVIEAGSDAYGVGRLSSWCS